MGNRIVSIYCHNHPSDYWYDIDKCLKNDRKFSESQTCGSGIMRISEGDDIYILCRYENRTEIKYKCIVDKIYMEPDGKRDPYEHNSNGYVSPFYFSANFIEAYVDGCFPLEKLRKFNLVSKHHQLNGDKVLKPLLDYIESNKRVVID